MEHRDEIIKCGEILLLKNVWDLRFSCGDCGSLFVKVHQFQVHILQHKLSVSDQDVKSFIQELDDSDEINNENEQESVAGTFEEVICEEAVESNESTMVTETSYEAVINTESTSAQMTNCDDFLRHEDADISTGEEKIELETIKDFKQKPKILKSCTKKKRKSGSTELKCDKCPKLFPSKRGLKRHIITIHEKAKPLTCEYCGANFFEKSNFNVHIKRHLGVKDHKCTICGMAFVSSTEKVHHMRTHTGERPHECEVCGRTFVRGSLLIAHRRRHTNERPHQCEQCSKRFMDRQQLVDHQTLHSSARPFQCLECSATFRRRKGLKEHKKLHLGIKKYVCQICQKNFAQYSGLYSHMKSHKKKKAGESTTQ